MSRKWGFTKWDREDFEKLKSEGTLISDGVGVQYKPNHGKLVDWKALTLKRLAA